MPKIIVFHYAHAARVPALTPAQCAEIRGKYDAALRNYPGVILHGVFVDPKGQGICEWEAPSVEMVKEIVTKVDGHPPADDVVLVSRII